MTDLPVCKLCDSAPLSAGQLGEDVFVRHTENICPVNSKRIFKCSEWIALMGVERDAARYRWLRDNDHLDDWLSVGNSHMDYAANIDADIDSAMGEQQ